MTILMTQTDNSITSIFLIEEKPSSILDRLQTQEDYTPFGPYAGGYFGWSKDINVDGSAIHLGIYYYL